jgi:hypothetical protein
VDKSATPSLLETPCDRDGEKYRGTSQWRERVVRYPPVVGVHFRHTHVVRHTQESDIDIRHQAHTAMTTRHRMVEAYFFLQATEAVHCESDNGSDVTLHGRIPARACDTKSEGLTL